MGPPLQAAYTLVNLPARVVIHAEVVQLRTAASHSVFLIFLAQNIALVPAAAAWPVCALAIHCCRGGELGGLFLLQAATAAVHLVLAAPLSCEQGFAWAEISAGWIIINGPASMAAAKSANKATWNIFFL